MTSLEEVFSAIRQEREYQDYKYGPPNERNLGLGDYVVIAGAELDEVRYDIIQNQHQHACLELLQVAAVCVAALQQHGVRLRK